MRDSSTLSAARPRTKRSRFGQVLAGIAGALLVAAVLPFASDTPPVLAAGPTSSLYFETDPNDGMGAGRTRLATSDDSTFGGYDNGTSIGVSGPVGWVVLTAYGPDGAHLVVGNYDDVASPGYPVAGKATLGFGWSGEGTGGCGTGDASFTVHEVEYGATQFAKLSLSFRAECGATGAWVAGELRYNTTAPAYPAILQAPTTRAPFEFGALAIGATGPTTGFELANAGTGPITLGSGALAGATPGDFTVLADTCSGATLPEGASCTFGIRFSPSATGDRSATLEFSTTTGLGHRRLDFKGYGLTPTVTTLDVPAGIVYGDLVLTVHTRPVPFIPGGYIPAVLINVSGGHGSWASFDQNGDATMSFRLEPGSYTVSASYPGHGDLAPSESQPAAVVVGSATHTYVSSSLNPVLSTQDVTITANVVPDHGTVSGGTLSIVDAFDGTTIASGPVGPGATSVTVTRRFATGDHPLTASYSGHGLYGASVGSLTQTAAPDLEVEASGLGVAYTAFYPVKDGYRDTVEVRGSLGEAASVLVRIYSPLGKLVKTMDLGARPPGAYASSWNGRKVTGTVLPAGKYRVVQQITDLGGNVLTATHYVTLSTKKLVWSTHTITQYGRQYRIYGDPGNGSVSRAASAYPRGVKLTSGTSWVAVRYTFTLRSATVYRPLTFKVLGRSPTRTTGYAGLWNPGYGSSRYVDTYDVRKVGPSYTWYPITVDASAHRSGRTAYGMVYVGYVTSKATFDVAKVRLTYQYAVLK